MKIRPVGAELFNADGQTNRLDEANSSFSQFSERLSQLHAEHLLQAICAQLLTPRNVQRSRLSNIVIIL